MNGVKVKRLEWIDQSGKTTILHVAKTPLGTFHACEEDAPMGGRHSWAFFYPDGGGRTPCITHSNTKKMSTAKQRCQEYFDALVLECLEVDNDPE